MDMNEWREWHERLESAFGLTNGSSPALAELAAAERSYGDYIQANYAGHRALWGAFSIFHHDTLTQVARTYPGYPTEEQAKYHPALFVDAIAVFRSFRAAEALLYSGYPLDGYALLRDLKDEAAYVAAMISGETDYVRLRGLGALTESAGTAEVKRAREREEKRLLPKYFGDASGLEVDVRDAIKRWSTLFNLEVHGSRLTTTDIVGWFRREHDLQIAPRPKSRIIGLYVSTVPVVAWMHLRCLPFLQLPGRALDATWQRQWHLLDESFRWLLSTWQSSALETGRALVRLVDTKFAFDPRHVYVERVLPADSTGA
jgi:hypothetical protein